MSEPQLKAFARVQLTIEIESGNVWGEDTQMSQVHKQAVEGAVAKLRKRFEGEPAGTLRIIGEPTITAIITERKP